MDNFVAAAEIGAFECFVHVFLVFFGDMKYEGPQAGVLVFSVLLPDGGSSYANYYACAGFTYLYG